MADFFTKEWADAVRDALTAGPDERARAVKLQEYWDFFDFLKSIYPASWALGCRDLPGLGATAYLFVQWSGGAVTDCRIIGPDDPLQATYVFGMDYRDWKALHDGYDAQRTVMYRKMLLEELWGGSDYREPRTIDVHVRHLREKLEAEPRTPEYILTVRGVGYRFRDR